MKKVATTGLVKGESIENLNRCIHHNCSKKGECHRYRLAAEEAPTAPIRGQGQVTTYTIFPRADGKCLNQIYFKS